MSLASSYNLPTQLDNRVASCNQLKATDARIVNCTAQLSCNRLVAAPQLRVLLRVLLATHLHLVYTYQYRREPALSQIVRDVNLHSLLSTAFRVAAFQCAA